MNCDRMPLYLSTYFPIFPDTWENLGKSSPTRNGFFGMVLLLVYIRVLVWRLSQRKVDRVAWANCFKVVYTRVWAYGLLILVWVAQKLRHHPYKRITHCQSLLHNVQPARDHVEPALRAIEVQQYRDITRSIHSQDDEFRPNPRCTYFCCFFYTSIYSY